MNTKENKFKPSGIPINTKLLAIEFARWVSNQNVLDDFWSMSIDVQEEAYEQFINENNLKK